MFADCRDPGRTEQLIGREPARPGLACALDAGADGRRLSEDLGGDTGEVVGASPRLIERPHHECAEIVRVGRSRKRPCALHEQSLGFRGFLHGERMPQRAQRIVHLAGRQESAGQIVVGVDEIGLARERKLELPAGLRKLALRREHDAEIVVCLRHLRPQRQGPPVALRRIVEPALRQIHVAQVRMGIGRIRLDAQRLFEPRRGLLELSLHEQHVAEVDMGLGKLGIERECTLKMRQRLVRATLRHQRIGEVVVRADQVRLEREHAAILRHGVVQPADLREHVGQIVVRLGRRLERDDALVARHRLGTAPDLHQRVAEIGMRLGIIGLEARGVLVVRDGLVQAAERLEREGDVVMALGNAIVDRERLPDRIDRRLRLAALQGEDADMVQGADVPAVGGQDLTVEVFGLEQ